ncbi:uncharacterized protein BKA55DRAFT_554472 [Fusarium redolens]|uniref:Uncharacterized protein n=1 Tax=Fusarium redolens TaxID=48865 RepID=A0A9P9KRC6_FUSRE|nr:uncharacterized protein BKA55DRAFT_554472 [Fusarium redolens]KAH7267136.1 hypothetical protein BKA55DRAFT_554472 [Fusarium redolens]
MRELNRRVQSQVKDKPATCKLQSDTLRDHFTVTPHYIFRPTFTCTLYRQSYMQSSNICFHSFT